jgi:hypothetical protein
MPNGLAQPADLKVGNGTQNWPVFGAKVGNGTKGLGEKRPTMRPCWKSHSKSPSSLLIFVKSAVDDSAVGQFPTLAPKTGQKWASFPLLLENPNHPATAQGELDIGGIAHRLLVPFLDGLVPPLQGEPDSPEGDSCFHPNPPKEKARFRGPAGNV